MRLGRAENPQAKMRFARKNCLTASSDRERLESHQARPRESKRTKRQKLREAAWRSWGRLTTEHLYGISCSRGIRARCWCIVDNVRNGWRTAHISSRHLASSLWTYLIQRSGVSPTALIGESSRSRSRVAKCGSFSVSRPTSTKSCSTQLYPPFSSSLRIAMRLHLSDKELPRFRKVNPVLSVMHP